MYIDTLYGLQLDYVRLGKSENLHVIALYSVSVRMFCSVI